MPKEERPIQIPYIDLGVKAMLNRSPDCIRLVLGLLVRTMYVSAVRYCFHIYFLGCNNA